VPGYWSDYVDEWAAGGLTDADKLVEKGWRTEKLPNGRTGWIPSPHLYRGARTNDYHHPERIFDNDEAR
jgi:hypothetical protein